MTGPSTTFGELLRQTREAAGFTRTVLAERSGLDVSHIYRMETGDRRPSRESAVALADALDVRGEPLNRWLSAAGYAPMPLMGTVRAAVRTRGSARRPAVRTDGMSGPEASLWKRLHAIGLEEDRLARLLGAAESAGPTESPRVSRLVAAALTRLAEMVESPIRTAVIPAAGGKHRLLAANVIQRLLLRAVRDAADAGVTHVILILPPGMDDALYAPLKDALDISVIPALTLSHRTQPLPNGLGDAILEAEEDVGTEPFAVILPDDVIEERARARRIRELPAMMKALPSVGRSHVIAVTSLPKMRMARSGVAVLGAREIAPRLFPVRELVEKPGPDHGVFRQRALGIVGRYLLQPDIFKALHRLRSKNARHIELTDALADSRRGGADVYAFELEAAPQDIGELLEQADALLGDGRD